MAAPISRFADPTATETEDFPGPCRCPGTPHERDSATWRTELGGGEMDAIRAVGVSSGAGDFYDWGAANDALIAKAVTEWSFVDAEGQPVPITRRNASLLDEETRVFLLEHIDTSVRAGRQNGKVPKASGGQSPDSSQGSRSRTRRTRTRR